MEIASKESLFQPGQPVSPERFKGRKQILEEILKYFPGVINGNPQHFFITGKRGMGKTSLANFVRDFAEKNYSMITAHIMNDSFHNVNELTTQIIERILNSIKSEAWSEKIFDILGDRIERIGFGGINIKFKPKDEELENIKDNFAFYLNDIVNRFEDKKGLFIVIDDINGLSETPEFANWYKSFADTLATSVDNPRICFMLTGYPEKYNRLYEQNPSVNRIFHVHELKALSDKDIELFYEDIFSFYNISINDDALEEMILYSSGMPTMMQEIGDATFWINTDDCIDIDDAFRGIIEAGQRIGLKYLQPLLDKKIRSAEYLSLFKKIGKQLVISPDSPFTKKEFENILVESEFQVFNGFIRRAKDLGIIELAGSKKRGEYQFTNHLFPIYFFILTINERNL